MQIHDTLAGLTVNIDELEPYARNPRRGNLDVIVDSLKRNGQYRPIVVNRRTSQVLAGNHTLAAALKLGWQRIAVTYVDVDVEQAARIVAVDNRANDLAGYDNEQLAALLSELPDLDGTGYSQEDLDELLAAGDGPGVAGEGLNDPDDAPEPPAEPVSVLGDVWLLGPHRVVCGDSTEAKWAELALAGERADCMWTDPPYGVDYVGKTKDALTISNDGAADLPKLLAGMFGIATGVLKPGAPVYIAYSDTFRATFEQAMRDAGWLFRQNLIWAKNTLVLGRSDYHYRHESILYGFTPGGDGRLGRGGERWYGDDAQTTVFEVDKPARSEDHPTKKPVELIVRQLTNSCPTRGLVYDAFGGSGSTLIAAHRLGMRAAVIELGPKFVDVICRRFQEHTGTLPVLQSTGEEHDFTANP